MRFYPKFQLKKKLLTSFASASALSEKGSKKEKQQNKTTTPSATPEPKQTVQQ